MTTEPELAPRPARPRWPYAALTVYFSLLILPKTLPAWSASQAYLLYLLSVPLVLVTLMLVGLWGGIGVLRATNRSRPRKREHWACVRAASVGLLAFSAALLVVRLLPSPLPPGSELREFDRAAWAAAGADERQNQAYSVRQQMLRDVIESELPGHSREQLIAELGPSTPDSPVSSEGADLAYRLGPQRVLALGLDSEWLLIWLRDGRYERYEIVGD
jgi:hypothetical protein